MQRQKTPRCATIKWIGDNVSPQKTASSYNWDALGSSWDQMITCKKKRWESFSFLSEQPTSSVNQQMCKLIWDLIERELLSSSSHNNSLVMSFNKCVNQLLCNTIQRGLLSPSSSDNQPVQSINKCIDDNFLSWYKGDFFLLPLTTKSTSNAN